MTEEMIKNDSTRYIVVLLNEADVAGGRPIVAIYDNEGDATKEAQRLALASTNREEFAVYQKLGSAQAEMRVNWRGAAL
jgi:hypothetical protein